MKTLALKCLYAGAIISCLTWAMPGHYHSMLANAKPMDHSFPAKGQPGFWTIPEGEIQ